MKKRLCIMMALICLFVSAFTFTGCSSVDYSDSPYVGTWVGTTAEYAGMEFSVADLFGDFTLTLEANGKATVVTGEDKASGKWEPTDSGVLLKDAGEDMELAADGDALTIEMDGVTVSFEKQ